MTHSTRLLCERNAGIRYHGNDEIREGGRFKTSLEIDQKLYYLARLQISNVAKADGGEYRAVAKNKQGQGTATINLNFEGGDKPKYANELKTKINHARTL